MEDIISKLAEIEAAASHIMDDVSEQKKQMAREYEEAVQAFDRTADEKVREKTLEIRRELEIQMNKKLEAQKSDTENTLRRMEEYYTENHSKLARQIYDRILRK